MRSMARIYILEPEADVRELLVRVADRLGHAAREYDDAAAEEIEPGDVLVVEPSDPASLSTTKELRERIPQLRIVCVSTYSGLPEAEALGPCSYVVKPFHLEELEEALRDAAG
jgi:DNA-binding NtrC family response regulator